MLSEDADIVALLALHNKKFKPKSDYVPQKHGVKEIKRVFLNIKVFSFIFSGKRNQGKIGIR